MFLCEILKNPAVVLLCNERWRAERRPPSLRKHLRFDEIVRAFFKLCCIIHTETTRALHLPVHCLLESIMQQLVEMSSSGTERSAWHISLLL